MTRRQTISTNTTWEVAYGYARAVRVGDVVEVAGTVAVDDSGQVAGETVYEQTRFILGKIERALQAAGAELRHVVRTRWYLTDIRTLDQAGRAHGERFAAIRPVATAIQVSALVEPAMLVEIEATAIVAD